MSINKYYIVTALIFMSIGMAAASPVTVNGTPLPPIAVTADKSSGLDEVLVVNSVYAPEVSYESSSTSTRPKWYRYSSLGGGYAEEIANVSYDGNMSAISNADTDMGYIIEDGDSRYYFWIVGYENHDLDITSVSVSDESDCDRTVLNVSGKGSEIHYYGINGRRFILPREIEVRYLNLEWNDERKNYEQTEQIKSIDGIDHAILITPPVYCATSFTIEGDRFLKVWNRQVSASTPTYHPVAVECHTSATQAEGDDNSNQISSGGDGLGGSAPAEIEFNAYITDAVIHTEWQISTDPDFGNIEYRLNGQDLSFTFRDEGTRYVRFVGSNDNGSCETYGDTYTVSIGASELKCPNAFSPGASEGVNDEWKVAYRSIVDFECWIFDRYGTKMYHFTDPSAGWDGCYRGKLVSPGVYYYVIKAKGADGKNYKLSGDINILRYKGRKGVNSGS